MTDPRLAWAMHFFPIKERVSGHDDISLSHFFTSKKALLSSIRLDIMKVRKDWELATLHSIYTLSYSILLRSSSPPLSLPSATLWLLKGSKLKAFLASFSDDHFLQMGYLIPYLGSLKVIVKVPGSKPS